MGREPQTAAEGFSVTLLKHAGCSIGKIGRSGFGFLTLGAGAQRLSIKTLEAWREWPQQKPQVNDLRLKR